jgi:hypothetical protein
MVVVVMADKHRVDRRQVLDPTRGGVRADWAGPLAGGAARGEDGVEEACYATPGPGPGVGMGGWGGVEGELEEEGGVA